jgi:hypothetical protein
MLSFSLVKCMLHNFYFFALVLRLETDHNRQVCLSELACNIDGSELAFKDRV